MTYGQEPRQNPLPDWYEIELRKTLTDAEQDACFNRGYKEGARDILNKPAKTLTDEEKSEIIEKVWSEMKDAVCLDYKSFGNELIRAILKKANEK